jgi:hypothetical protein
LAMSWHGHWDTLNGVPTQAQSEKSANVQT